MPRKKLASYRPTVHAQGRQSLADSPQVDLRALLTDILDLSSRCRGESALRDGLSSLLAKYGIPVPSTYAVEGKQCDWVRDGVVVVEIESPRSFSRAYSYRRAIDQLVGQQGQRGYMDLYAVPVGVVWDGYSIGWVRRGPRGFLPDPVPAPLDEQSLRRLVDLLTV